MADTDDSYCRILAENLFEGVYYVDGDRKITYWNPGAEKITGFLSSEVIGKGCSESILVHVDENGCCLCDEECSLKKTLDKGHGCEGEAFFRHKEGYRVPVEIRTKPLMDAKGQTSGAISIFRENKTSHAIKQTIEELRKLALIDSLTGLPNRRYLERNLHSKLEEMHRYGVSFGVLFIDIDKFKQINDAFGHDVGDSVLKMVSGTLAHSMRAFDVVGRWGGEEFVAIVTNVTGQDLLGIAEKQRALVEQSELQTSSGPVRVTVSIGAALAEEKDTEDALIKRSDLLMYQSKEQGRNRTTIVLREIDKTGR